MSDKIFERSLTALTALVVIWIIVGWIMVMGGWALVTGLIVEIGGGGALLYFWGKGYMSRTQ